MSLRIGLAALALAGCIVGPDYERPTVPLPDAFTGADATTALADSVPPQWWRLFGDATLDELVAIARANNIDIRQAVARIEEADANLRAVHAALFPEIDLGGTANRTAFSSAVASPPRAQDLSTRYAKEVVTLSIAALTTQTYFSLRSLDAQIASTRATLATREDTLSIVRRRAEAGLASDLDVRQAEVARFDAALQLDELTRQREIAEHLLATLTGKLDLTLVPGDITQLPRPAAPPAGLPSTLLERRPDIRQAEADLIAANAQIGVAKAQLFPTITLTGNFGGESAALAGLFTLPGRIWALGANLSAPIFEGGKLSALVDVQRARRQQSLANYQRVIQTSFREVVDALTNVRQYAATERDAQASVDAAREALRLATIRYEAGYTRFLDVLDSQRSLNISELALIRSRQNLLSANVDLMKALGGGWQPEERTAGR